MKRIFAIAIAATAAGSLTMGAAPAIAASNPAGTAIPASTTEVAHSGNYESVVTCPNWVGAKSAIVPLLSAPYAPKTATDSQSSSTQGVVKSRTAPYDPMVTCSVTFLQRAPRITSGRNARFAAGPVMHAMSGASARACARSGAMRPGGQACCESSRPGTRGAMVTCCAPKMTSGGHMIGACCITAGGSAGHMRGGCCAILRRMGANAPGCFLLNTGFGGMAAKVARHTPVTVTRRPASQPQALAAHPRR